jgi:hypothetical protein
MNKKNIIDKYIKGTLSGEDLKNFEKELLSDHQLAEEVKLQHEIDEALKEKDVMELHAQLNGIFENIKEEITNKEAAPKAAEIKTKPKYIFNMKWQYAAAAGLAALVGVSGIFYVTMRPAQNDRLYAQYFKPYDAPSIVRSGSAPTEDNYQQAMNEYNSGNYKQAFDMLDKLSADDHKDMSVLFFKGISAMELNKLEDALALFEKIISNKSSLYTESAEWYQALCLLKKNNKTDAIVLFGKIASSNSYYKNEAKKILEKIS